MDWYEITDNYHGWAIGSRDDLLALPHEWQRELAAIWRAEADMNNGSYLQFIGNWGVCTYDYAVQGLHKMGANEMAQILEACQTLIIENTDPSLPDSVRFRDLMPNPIIKPDGSISQPPPSLLPDEVLQRIYDLSDQFTAYPEDLSQLGVSCYGVLVICDITGPT